VLDGCVLFMSLQVDFCKSFVQVTTTIHLHFDLLKMLAQQKQ
jgi:hypothetical protein